MKKFLLSSVFVLLISSLFAQNQCPISFKRNNGNGSGAAGNITLDFATPPLQTLYISSIIEVGTLNEATITGAPSFKNNSVTYAFQFNNLGPAGVLLINFFYDGNLNQIKDNGETGYTCNTTQNAPLPVTLINFNAAQKSNKVSLSWETTFEQNNKGFEVERRIGNGNYEKIAFVASKEIAGNGGGNSYSFEDNTVLSKGVSYYRLRQVDYDGRVAFSEVKAIRTGNGSITLSVYPNPSRGTTNVAIPAGVGSVDVSVDDFTGKSIQRFSGLNTQNLQLTNLKPGMYMLRVSIRATGETITERIAVQ
jgi:hypothetical protein